MKIAPYLIFHPPWRRPVVPLYCSMQKICGFRWNFTYIPSPMSGSSFPVSRPPFWFPVEIASHCAQGDVAISTGDFGILKNKCSNVEFAFNGDLRPLIQWSSSLSHFHQQIIHTTFTSGDLIRWTISKISMSFHQALMVLGIHRSPMENSDGQLRYSRKTKGVQLCTPRSSRVNKTYLWSYCHSHNFNDSSISEITS